MSERIKFDSKKIHGCEFCGNCSADSYEHGRHGSGGQCSGKESWKRSTILLTRKSCDLVVLGGRRQRSGRGGACSAADRQKGNRSGKGLFNRRRRPVCPYHPHLRQQMAGKTQSARYDHGVCPRYDGLVYWRLDPKLVTNCLLGTGQFLTGCANRAAILRTCSVPANTSCGASRASLLALRWIPQKWTGFGDFVMDMMKEKCQNLRC